MSLTIKYKCGFIHIKNDRYFTVQVDAYSYPIEVKSIHAAKIIITNHFKSGRAL